MCFFHQGPEDQLFAVRRQGATSQGSCLAAAVEGDFNLKMLLDFWHQQIPVAGIQGRVPQNGWFLMELKWMIWGYPYFRKHPYGCFLKWWYQVVSPKHPKMIIFRKIGKPTIYHGRNRRVPRCLREPQESPSNSSVYKKVSRNGSM